MKFRITMKTPDVLEDTIREETKSFTVEDESAPTFYGVMKQCEQWFDYGEYLTVEIDTEANTCIVVSV